MMMHSRCCVLLAAGALMLWQEHGGLWVRAQRLNCDPCIDRKTYNIKAIVHGTKGDPFWEELQEAAEQSGVDMNVNFDMQLYDSFSHEAMASDIQNVASSSDPPDALIVSVPTTTVLSAAENAATAGIPVFGVNRGDDLQDAGFFDFVGMDQQGAGEDAAKEMIELRAGEDEIANALYINHNVNSGAYGSRYTGFQRGFGSGVTVEQLTVTDPTSADITSKLSGCNYQAVLLAGSATMETAVQALENCPTILGTFDTNQQVYDAIAAGDVNFAVSEQSFLQGALPVVMAAMYASTGKKIVPPTSSRTHAYLAGPKIITLENLPSNTLQTCEREGFPICPDDKSVDGTTPAECECTDRSKIKIAGVLHGVTTDDFWNPVYEASRTAANDFDVELLLDRPEPVNDQALLHQKMAEKMKSYCAQDIDGLFVTIPSNDVVDALKECQDLNIPIVSINTGIETAKELGLLHHVGMLEFNAGYGGGKRMISAGLKKGLCTDHEPGNTALIDRCNGFAKAINETNGAVEYLGKVDVPLDNHAQYVAVVEEKLGDLADEAGVGIFLGGQPQTEEGLEVQEAHPTLLLGSVDTNDVMYKAIGEGKILFGIQQGPYMQGYMPIPMLAWKAYTSQNLQNLAIESGPSFVDEAPGEAQTACEVSMYQTCDMQQGEDGGSRASSTEDSSNNLVAIVVPVVIAAAVLIGGICFVNHRLDKVSKHVEELKKEGKDVPDLSFAEKMSGVVQPVEEVVDKRIT